VDVVRHIKLHDSKYVNFNPLNAELDPICHLLALLGVHYFLHVSRIRVKIRGMVNLILNKFSRMIDS
jgi:hypothetical protein